MSFEFVMKFATPRLSFRSSIPAVAIMAILAAPLQADDISFNRDIKPLLSENCFTCHGPDEEKLEGGFRLDVRESAIGEADSGEHPIVPGNSAKSEIIARMMSTDADVKMPPPETGKRLTSKQIGLLKTWINDGAEYERHWAFVTPQRPSVPQTAGWARNPIDHFIAARLKKEGLKPSPEADRETLLRRITLDLTGLPPTPDELANYLKDTSGNAYEKAVDRLLASPHYGERMALPWLDQARYADSNGYQSDGSRDMWPWRDWVINAFNENKPFDQFTVEQLAGDMLPGATKAQIIATGFNRNHRLNGEGGRIVDEWFVETVIDRVETTGMTWLGLTMNCCRCHDHKYDPISQAEFYQFFAYFNSNDESGVLAPNGKNGDNTPPVLELPTEQQLAKEKELRQSVAELKTEVADLKSRLPELVRQWAEVERSKLDNGDLTDVWSLLDVTAAKSLKGATLKKLDDATYLASGKNPGNDVYEIKAPVNGSVSGLLLEVMPHDTLPTKSLGRASNGNFVLTGVTAKVMSPALNEPIKLFLKTATADFAQAGWTAQSILGNNPQPGKPGSNRKGWAIEGLKAENRVPRKVMFRSDKPLELPADAVLTITMRHDSPYADHNVGRFRWSMTSLPPEEVKLTPTGMPVDVAAAIRKDAKTRTKADIAVLTKYYNTQVPNPLKETTARVKAQEKELSTHLKSYLSTMVMRESKKRDAFILTRGEYDKPGDKVARGVPDALGAATDPKDRLELARWIASPSNPLTARVWVNRTWERFFGTGIVKTTENLGSQAEFPSHPQLLDWLAVEFMSPTVMPDVHGKPALAWDMKAFQKMILMSATYRQSSHVTSELVAKDPENRLLARGPRFRLTGELIRDSALAAGGLLVPKIGGPSTRPYMPAGVWDETSKYGNLRNYKHEKGDGLHRRSMYTIWKRTAAPPTMLLFDAPNRETCTVKRSKTNTPLQALSLLNEVTFVEASRGLATRMINEGGDTPESRITFAFRATLTRDPTKDEVEILAEGLADDLARFSKDETAAKALVAFGDSPVGRELPLNKLAAYTLTANVILNLDEFVTKE